jgi:phthiodiolone/phenolphthiodiolone dimycocerosates ketoreductase
MGLAVGVGVGGRPPARLTLAAARLFDTAGAASLWVIDHWMGLVPLELWEPHRFPAARIARNPDELFDPFPTLGALSQRTRRALLGVGVTDAIRRHPAQLAQAALTLHHLSRGRFVLGIGAGERESIEPYGLSYEGQASRLEEALYLIRLLWKSRDRYVSHEGRFFRLDGAIVGLGPYRRTFPPIWVAAHRPRTLRIAGRYGDGWYPTHQMEPDEYADSLGAIRMAAEEAGRTIRRFTPCYNMRVLFADSHEDAHRLLDSPILRLAALIVPAEVWAKAGASHPMGDGFRGVQDWVPSRLDAGQVEKWMGEVPFEVVHQAFDHGTWRQISARILSYRAVGLRHAVLSQLGPVIEPRRAPASFRDSIRVIRALRAV